MAYFIPSYIQKRLLRYALSRLEFLDTDALDLDKLDIAWGRKSTVELKDVAFRKAKLSSILQLPKSLEIREASIALLRLTVPADLHSASIVVEFDGVEARVKLLPLSGNENTATGSHPRSNPAPHSDDRSSRRRSPPPSSPPRLAGDDFRSSHDFKGDSEDFLPNPHFLAQSFLAEEPRAEKEQLEAALTSQSTDLRQSVLSTGSNDDDLAYGTDYGVGVTLDLPQFLAGFLKGVVDRLQVIASGISIKLDVPLDSLSDENFATPPSKSSSDTTFVLEIQGARIHPTDDSQPLEQDTSSLDTSFMAGTRCVTFTRVEGSILSDAGTFSSISETLEKSIRDRRDNVAHVPSPDIPSSEPRATESPIHSPVHTTIAESSVQTHFTSNNESGELEPSSDGPSPTSSGSPFKAHLERSTSSQDPFEFQSTYDHAALRKFRQEKSMLASKRSSQVSTGTRDGTVQKSHEASYFSNTSMPGMFQSAGDILPLSDSDNLQNAIVDEHEHYPSGSDRADSNDELVESRLYSHDEAESIYMSAVYDTSQSKGVQPQIPGQSDGDDGLYLPQDGSLHHMSGLGIDAGPTQAASETQMAEARDLDTSIASALGSTTSEPKPEFQRISSFKPESPPVPLDMKEAATATTLSSGTLSIPFFNLSGARISLFSSGQRGAQPDNGNPTASDSSYSVSQVKESRHMPGSFSVYAESTASLAKSTSRPRTSTTKSIPEQPRNVNIASEKSPKSIDVMLDDLSIKFDPTTCKILAQLADKLISSDTDTAYATKQPLAKPSADQPLIALKLHLKSLEASLDDSFTDRSPKLSATSSIPSPVPGGNADNCLLRLSLKDFIVKVDNLRSIKRGLLEIRQLRFGFIDEDMISFTQETKLRTSLYDVRDVFDKDIRIDFNLNNAVPEINVVTQPIRVAIDLQKLDNTLGSIGGLSGLLELGSSVLSDTTVTGNTTSHQQRQRTVRFEASVSVPSDRDQPRHSRVNLKINGSTLTFRGKETSLVYQSSAIKVVARSTLVGVQIDDMKLTGPHLSRSVVQPIGIRCSETRLKYLFAPEEHDLTRLISLLTPSKDKFEEDDDFLIDTLIKQRKKGAVLRINLSKLEASCPDPKAMGLLQEFANEASKLSVVTKFLPKETRPGLMTLCAIETISLDFETGLKLGGISSELKGIDIAHVSAPSLVALAVGKVSVESPRYGKLLTEVVPQSSSDYQPMLMTRMIEDELDPSVRVKLWNVSIEYSAPLLVAFMDMESDVTRDELVVDLTKSVAALAGPSKLPSRSSMPLDKSQNSKSLKLDFALRECAIGLVPRSMPSKAMFILDDSRVLAKVPGTGQKFALSIDLRKAGLLLIDDTKHLSEAEIPKSSSLLGQKPLKYLTDKLCLQGFVSVASISAASVAVSVTSSNVDGHEVLDIELKDRLCVLETCADSTQTLIDTFNGLAPPARPSVGQKYRTEVAPVEDMMASFTGEAFPIATMGNSVRSELDDEDYLNEDFSAGFDDLEDSVESVDEFLQTRNLDETSGDGITGEIELLNATPRQSTHSALPKSQLREAAAGSFVLGEMPPQTQATARKWDSNNNRYVPVRKAEVKVCPLKVRVLETHIIWNLFDGYDWERTRDTITKAVQVVEAKAEERMKNRRIAIDADDDEDSVIGDFLFNSIYIGIPLNSDPKDLSHQINGNIDDLVSETASQTPSHTSTTTTSRLSRPSSSPRPRSQPRRLKLNRSRRHKITFELRDISVDHFAFLPGNETQSSTDIRIENVEIFDHVPTSTWKKFATYMHDAGPREDKKPMLHLEICDVRPVPELTATELVIRVTILPLRLHVDQDALDFITRFFEFSDSTKGSTQQAADQPYLQRVEVRPIPVKLDYKPKKVDYAGLRSGRTNEFMNFFSLDAADFVLKHVVIYGTSGMLKLHRSLEDVWMPDVKKNQLPTVLSGLNGIRTFVNLGAGVRDLVAIPIQEYQKDGRIVRSISKGALAFARTTGSELTKFGAKVAVGAQTALQGAEGYLSGQGRAEEPGWEDGDLDAEEKRAISHYANHPAGILQGLKGAARSLERDLLLTRDVIVAVSGEVRESTSAEGAARAVARHAPTLILRPVIGASKAISQTLMGATNTVDPANRRRIEDKYKRY